MSHAGEVRSYCNENFVEPARMNGENQVTIRAGDVHEILGYRNRYPFVCSALGSLVFEGLCNVQRISIEGPLNGANTYFTSSVPTFNQIKTVGYSFLRNHFCSLNL